MAHINEKIDYTVDVYIVYKNKVLLRKHDKYVIWLGVGGHLEPGEEDFNEAALREVDEEVGLEVELYRDPRAPVIEDDNYTELIPPVFMNRHHINDTHEHVTLVYFARSKTDKVVASEEEKSEEYRWFTKEELDDPKYGLKQKVKVYAKAALEALVD
jgi:8-oxo-dGTP pyrophosphatase MutT (NUDIX family)